MTQQLLMKFDPSTGNIRPYPSHATQWRKYYGERTWLYNPWNGKIRETYDIVDDPFGLLLNEE